MLAIRSFCYYNVMKLTVCNSLYGRASEVSESVAFSRPGTCSVGLHQLLQRYEVEPNSL